MYVTTGTALVCINEYALYVLGQIPVWLALRLEMSPINPIALNKKAVQISFLNAIV